MGVREEGCGQTTQARSACCRCAAVAAATASRPPSAPTCACDPWLLLCFLLCQQKQLTHSLRRRKEGELGALQGEKPLGGLLCPGTLKPEICVKPKRRLNVCLSLNFMNFVGNSGRCVGWDELQVEVIKSRIWWAVGLPLPSQTHLQHQTNRRNARAAIRGSHHGFVPLQPVQPARLAAGLNTAPCILRRGAGKSAVEGCYNGHAPLWLGRRLVTPPPHQTCTNGGGTHVQRDTCF